MTGRDFPTNRGGLCQKGWTAAELLTRPDRLRTPMLRDSRPAPFRFATWDQALDRIAGSIGGIQRRYGKDAAGVFGGGGLTNEKAYLLGKFRPSARSARWRESWGPAAPGRRCSPARPGIERQ